MNEFSQVDFGPIQVYLDNDDVTDISYSNGGQVWLKTLSKGVFRVENPAVNNAFMEKMAFQCANTMGKSFNMANPFLDAESDELRMNFVHDSIARNGIAVLIRKTPAKIRLEKDKILKEDYIRLDIHDFLLKCVEGHCNILVSGETGSGKTEFIKYLAAHTKPDEKIITIEDTLELHLDKIFPQRDIVAMKTNNIASYADVLVTCMRQNPRWILLSEVRSAEAVMAVRDSISSGHNILSTIHAEKAESIPSRLYSLLESSIDMDQFLRSIHRYVQLGVHIRGYYSKELQRFKREVAEVVEFYVDEDNNPKYKILYKRTPDGKFTLQNPSKYLLGYLESQGVIMQPDILVKESFHEANDNSLNYNNEKVNILDKQSNIAQNNNENIVQNNNQVLSNNVANTTVLQNNSINSSINPMLNYEIINESRGVNNSNISNLNINNVGDNIGKINNSTVTSNVNSSYNVNNNQYSKLQNSVEKNSNILYTNVNGSNV
ncbi:MAG: type II/IV secretion system ATPase subunit [Bacilli bacterium]|nr:type II/IV secretion system ATPase subunit [Bacilli bacterium]